MAQDSVGVNVVWQPGLGPDIRVTMVYTETVTQGGPDVRVTMVYTETVVKP